MTNRGRIERYIDEARLKEWRDYADWYKLVIDGGPHYLLRPTESEAIREMSALAADGHKVELEVLEGQRGMSAWQRGDPLPPWCRRASPQTLARLDRGEQDEIQEAEEGRA